MKKLTLGPGREWKVAVIKTCPLCKKGKMRIQKEILEPDGVEYEAISCVHCGESFLTMGQLDVLADKYRKLRRAKEVTFSKWGNSLAMRIPKAVAKEYKLSSGKTALLVQEKKGIRIVPM
ncbi:MAG: AbrB/MazE/SpoVT family DNA-binding domain-containing protein [Nanoarchaeota archaeon]